jgi:hypothetical protein
MQVKLIYHPALKRDHFQADRERGRSGRQTDRTFNLMAANQIRLAEKASIQKRFSHPKDRSMTKYNLFSWIT